MLKVLIVDDEVLTIEYLKSFPSWEKFGCAQIDSVWIASRAMECFKRERHDIVFLDVRMPGVDGLTLSREILQLEPDTMIVIMTAWQEYQYVKEAMGIGVKHFLAKHEITEETLDTVLGKICEDMERKKHYHRVLWNSSLHRIWEGSREELPSSGENPYFWVMITLRGLTVLKNDEKERYVNEEQIRAIIIPGIVVQAFSRLESYAYGILCEYRPPVSTQMQKEDMLSFLCEVKKICLENTGLRPVFFLSDQKKSGQEFLDFSVNVKKFIPCVLWNRQEVVYESEFQQFSEITQDVLPGYKTEEWSEETLRTLLDVGREKKCFVKLQKIASVAGDFQERVDLAWLREQEQQVGIISIEQILRYALGYLEKQYVQKSKLVRKAQDYIRKHYAEDISSTAIAEKLHVSDGYLRTVFKRELSCTIKDYILQYRIERSKEMLLKDGKKIYEIAAECGFMSSQHFSRVFRQETGMTPGEYKKR